MVNDFTFYNPTKIHFGKGALQNLSYELANFKKVLLVYEKQVIKKTGIYDKVKKVLSKTKIEVIEFNKVLPNPLDLLCEEGAKVASKTNVDLILGVGGGSTIDTAKAIALLATNSGDKIYDYIDQKAKPQNKPLPIGIILTSAASSSENSPALVISNSKDSRKTSYFLQDLFPKFAICNPEFTFTLPKFQTASGAFDIFSHVVEQFLSYESFDASEIPSINQLKALVKWTPIALKDPHNYEARANIMWCSSLALNGHGYIGKHPGWYAHGLSYPITSKYNIPHGAAVALIMPHLFEYQMKYGNNLVIFKKRIQDISNVIFGHRDAKRFLEDFKNLIRSWGLFIDYKDYNIDPPQHNELQKLAKEGFLGHSNPSFLDTTNQHAFNIYRKILT